MGLVLAAPAELLAPPAETPSAAAAQTAPADGLFASLLASLSAAVAGESGEAMVDANALPATSSGDEESAEKSETDPFAELLAMSVALPITAPPPEPIHGDEAFSQGNDRGSGHGRTSGIEVNHELSESITTAMAAQSAETAPVGTEIPTEALVAEPGIAQPFTPAQATETGAAAGASKSGATEAIASLAPAQATKTNVDAPEAKQSTATPASEADPPGQAGTSNETQGVVRSVGNAESNETAAGDGNNGKERGRSESSDRPLPRASAQGVLHAADGSAVAQLRSTDAPAPTDAVVPLPTDATNMADTPPQVEQVAQTVIESVEVGRGEARIHLDPAGMGEVTIHVRAEHGDVRVEIRAERHEAAQLLRDHTQDLSNLLGQRGLNLSDVNVGLGRGNGDQAWGREENPNRNTSGNEFASILGIDEPAALDTHNRLRAAYNPDGALVYRV